MKITAQIFSCETEQYSLQKHITFTISSFLPSQFSISITISISWIHVRNNPDCCKVCSTVRWRHWIHVCNNPDCYKVCSVTLLDGLIWVHVHNNPAIKRALPPLSSPGYHHLTLSNINITKRCNYCMTHIPKEEKTRAHAHSHIKMSMEGIKNVVFFFYMWWRLSTHAEGAVL